MYSNFYKERCIEDYPEMEVKSNSVPFQNRCSSPLNPRRRTNDVYYSSNSEGTTYEAAPDWAPLTSREPEYHHTECSNKIRRVPERRASLEGISMEDLLEQMNGDHEDNTRRVPERRASLGISMEDLLELTGDHVDYDNSSRFLTKPMARRRTSLDLVFSAGKLTGDFIDNDNGSGLLTKPLALASRRTSLDLVFAAADKRSAHDNYLDTSYHTSHTSIQHDNISLGDEKDDIDNCLDPDSLFALGQLCATDNPIQDDAVISCTSSCSYESSQHKEEAYNSSESPFDPSSPHYSPEFLSNYKKYLKSLIECMNKSQHSRMQVQKIKDIMRHKNTQGATVVKRNSAISIKAARRKNKKDRKVVKRTNANLYKGPYDVIPEHTNSFHFPGNNCCDIQKLVDGPSPSIVSNSHQKTADDFYPIMIQPQQHTSSSCSAFQQPPRRVPMRRTSSSFSLLSFQTQFFPNH